MRVLRLLASASLACVLAGCGQEPAAEKPAAQASSTVVASGLAKVEFPVPASTSGPGSVEQVCQTIRYHEMGYFRDLVAAGNLKKDDDRKAAITKFVAALKVQRSRTDKSDLQKAVDRYVSDLEDLLGAENIGVLSRGRLVLACSDREMGIGIDRKPFHHVTDPGIVSSIQAGCAEYVPVVEEHLKVYGEVFAAVRTQATGTQAESEAQRLKQTMKKLSELDTRLAAAARDYDLQSAWKLQAQLLTEALTDGTTAKQLVNAEALLSEEFDVVDQVLQRYCGTKGR